MIRMLGEIDALTLVMVLAGATYLGVLGVFGFDMLSVWPELRGFVYSLIGASALWQWGR
jgi:uncharacterized membrane protein YuzA (DUF378 family)